MQALSQYVPLPTSSAQELQLEALRTRVAQLEAQAKGRELHVSWLELQLREYKAG